MRAVRPLAILAAGSTGLALSVAGLVMAGPAQAAALNGPGKMPAGMTRMMDGGKMPAGMTRMMDAAETSGA